MKLTSVFLSVFIVFNIHIVLSQSLQRKTSADTLIYSYKKIYRQSPNLTKINVFGQPNDTTYISVEYPEFKGSSTNKLILNILLERENAYFKVKIKTLEDYTNGFIAVYDSYFKNDKENALNWYRNIVIRVKEQTPEFIVFEQNYLDYEGEPIHATKEILYANYNLITNSKIILNDLFTNENLKRFNRIAETEFRKSEKLKPDEDLGYNYFFKDGASSLNHNFKITKKGLQFMYNPREIKTYPEGETILFIPVSKFKSIIKKNSIISNYYN